MYCLLLCCVSDWFNFLSSFMGNEVLLPLTSFNKSIDKQPGNLVDLSLKVFKLLLKMNFPIETMNGVLLLEPTAIHFEQPVTTL